MASLPGLPCKNTMVASSADHQAQSGGGSAFQNRRIYPSCLTFLSGVQEEQNGRQAAQLGNPRSTKPPSLQAMSDEDLGRHYVILTAKSLLDLTYVKAACKYRAL